MILADKRLFHVGTFYHPKADKDPVSEAGIKRRYAAYTRDYNLSWQSCVQISVRAENGSQAKEYAIQRRMNMELEKALKQAGKYKEEENES